MGTFDKLIIVFAKNNTISKVNENCLNTIREKRVLTIKLLSSFKIVEITDPQKVYQVNF